MVNNLSNNNNFNLNVKWLLDGLIILATIEIYVTGFSQGVSFGLVS